MSVDGRRVEAERDYLDVGGRAMAPDMPGQPDIDYLTKFGMIALDTLPEHLAIVG